MRCPLAGTSTFNPPIHEIGNSPESMFIFHVTRIPVNVNRRLDCILETELQLGNQRACEERKKSYKSKTEAGPRSKKWSHCEWSGQIDEG